MLERFSCLLGALVALAFIGCDSTVSSDYSSPTENDSQPMSLYDAEFLYNYKLLDIFYYNAHIRNELEDHVSAYYQKGSAADVGKSGCTEGYYDICYMYKQMSDHYTRYFDPFYAAEVYNSYVKTEDVVGIGAFVEEKKDESGSRLVVSQVYRKSPADKADIEKGDVIVSVDEAVPATVSNFEKLIGGAIGDTIRLVVLRGKDTLSKDVVLEEFLEPSVFVTYEDSIPVIQITTFVSKSVSDSGTYGEFIDALKETEGAKSTIIDLRQNLGGIVTQCNDISAEFLNKGDTIIVDVEAMLDSIEVNDSVQYVQGFDTLTITAAEDGIGRNRYYVLLADTATASCAEVVLSAVSINKKAPIVGMISYGKAIRQLLHPTEYANGLAIITDAVAYDKNFDCYHDKGIVPDYAIGNPDEMMKKAVELAKGGSEKRTAGYGTKNLNHFSKRKAFEETPENYKKAFGRVHFAKWPR